MDFHNDIAAELPPMSDQPSSLRRDICDELADHLTCSVDRESAEEDDEEQIRERVLERFGNPARIARQLWFDAIKGKLMLQKFATGFAALAALAAIAGCVILWFAVDSGRDAVAQALAEHRKDREQNARANAALLTKLEKLAAQSKQPAKSMDWNPLKFKLLLGEQGNEPAVGYSVSLDRSPYDSEKQGVQKKSDKNGFVDFGRVRPGYYSGRVSTPLYFRRHISVTVTPGESQEVTVRCPKEQPVKTKVKLAVDWPQDLVDQKANVLINLYNSRQLVGTRSWTRSGSRGYFLISNTGPAKPYSNLQKYSTGRSTPSPEYGSLSLSEYHSAEWLTAEYRIGEMYVLVEPDEDMKPRSGRVLRLPFNERPQWLFAGSMKFNVHAADDKNVPSFTPQAGKENVWTIKLPEWLLKDARATFATINERKKEAARSRAVYDRLVKSIAGINAKVDRLTESEKLSLVMIARNYFKYLDEAGNSDGKLQEQEWEQSKRIKPIFVKGKVDLKAEMAEGEFVKHYIRLIGADDATFKSTQERNRARRGFTRRPRLQP